MPELRIWNSVDLSKVDAYCKAFEAAYEAFREDEEQFRQGTDTKPAAPTVHEYLPSTPDERTRILPWLLHLYLELHHRNESNTLLIEAYFEQFADLDRNLALSLIEEQWHILISHDRKPPLEEYARQFPNYENDLKLRLGPPQLPARYQFFEEISRGGQGIIWRVEDKEIGRPVALKQLLPNADSGCERLTLEADITGQLDQHPGIPHVYDKGRLPNGEPFFSMKLVEGHTLHDLLCRRSSPQADLPRFLKVFEETARAVAYAHSRGFVHRDLKPSNVMVGAFGEVQVMDWGLAKARNVGTESATNGTGEKPTAAPRFWQPEARTLPGTVLGTPAFMAPEQARGNVAELDERCDVFALGSILCCILTEKPPYVGNRPSEVYDKAQRGDLADAFHRLDNSRADSELINLAKSCLSVELETRPASAEEVVRAVANYQESVQDRLRHAELERTAAEARAEEEKRTRRAEEQARREAEARAAAEKSRRKRTVALALTVIAALLIIGAFGSWFVVQREQARLSALTFASEADDFLVRGSAAEARTRAHAGKTAIAGQHGFEALHQHLDRLLARADARLRLDEFRHKCAEAEYHLLGRCLAFAPAQQPESGLGFSRLYERGASLSTGITLGEQALALYRLPDDLGPVDRLEDLELSDDEGSSLQRRAANLLSLTALGLHQQGGELPPMEKQDLWRRAIRHFNAAESLGLRSRFLYQQRAALRQSLGETQRASEDGERAKSASADQFLDYRWQAAEAGRAGDWEKATALWETIVGLNRNDYWGLHRFAYALKQKGDSGRARDVLLSCKGLRPKDPTAFNESGVTLLDLELWLEAVAEFREVIRLDPDYLIAYGNLIRAYGMMYRLEDAEAAFHEYYRRDPQKPVERAAVHANLGMAYDRNQQHQRAISEFTEAIRLDPEHLLAYRNRSIAYRQLQKYTDAERDARKAIELRPEDADLWYVLGYLYHEWERIPEALESYSNSIKNDPRLVRAYRQRRQVYIHLQTWDKALADADRVIELEPSDDDRYARAIIRASARDYKASPNDLYYLIHGTSTPDVKWVRMRGELFGRLGRYEESELDLTQAIVMDNKDPVTYRNRAVTRMKLKKYEGAIEDFRAYLKLKPDENDAIGIHNDIGSAYLELGRYDEALELFSMIISREPLTSAYLNRGQTFMRLSQMDKAIDDFTAVVKLDAEHPAAWALRGQAWLRMGMPGDAEDDLKNSLQLEPGRTETLVTLASASLALGTPDEAREHLKAALAKSSDSVRIHFARGMLAHIEQRHGEAVEELSQALDDAILQPLALELRARSWLGVGDQGVKPALADADRLARLLPKEGYAQLQSARIYALAMKSAPEEVALLSARSLELLGEAVKLSPALRDQLEVDDSIDSLRNSPGFPGPLNEP